MKFTSLPKNNNSINNVPGTRDYNTYVENQYLKLLFIFTILVVIILPAFHFILRLIPNAPPDSLELRFMGAGISIVLLCLGLFIKQLRSKMFILMIINISVIIMVTLQLVIDSNNHVLYLTASLTSIYGSSIIILRLRDWMIVLFISFGYYCVSAYTHGLLNSPEGFLPIFYYLSNFIITIALVAFRVRSHKNEFMARLEVQEKNDQIIESIKYALTIQQAILPLKEKMKDVLGEYFVLYKPQAIVSGDFYWLSQIEDKIFIAVVDCTGHGVPGGFISMIGNTLLNKIVNENKIYSPAIILEHLNEEVSASLKQKNVDLEDEIKISDGMDVCLCVIDKEKKKLTYAGAKRPLYIIENKNMSILKEIKGDRISIGEIKRNKKIVFTDHSISIETGDMIYLTSDGFADQNNSNGRSYGSHKLKSLLIDISNKNAIEQKQLLISELSHHQQDETQRDDITIVGIRI